MKSLNINRTLVALLLLVPFTAAHAEKADRSKPIHLEADRVSIDDAKQINTFEGNVQLSQGTLRLRGDRMVVVQDKDGNMRGTATGQPANFRQKREGLNEYIEGYGQRIEYESGSEILNIFGKARITRAQDEVRGEHITYNARTEIFQVRGSQPDTQGESGRVHVVIQPRSKADDDEASSTESDAPPLDTPGSKP